MIPIISRTTLKDYIRLVRQFGLRRSLRWFIITSKLLNRIGSISFRGGLVIHAMGLDTDSDGFFDAFEVNIDNSILTEASIIRLQTYLNDELIPPENIKIQIDESEISGNRISEKQPLVILPGSNFKATFLLNKKIKEKILNLRLQLYVRTNKNPITLPFKVRIM